MDLNRPKGNYPIPFDSVGNLLSFPTPKYNLDTNTGRLYLVASSIVWRPNYKFDASIEFGGVEQGSSAIKYKFVDIETKVCYTMFMRDFVELIKTKSIVKGIVNGSFEFVKRGSYYGIKLSSA